MHQKPHISMRVRRWGVRLVLPVVACLVILTQLTARSEAVMRGPIDVKLGQVAYALNGRIDVGSIEPVGLWGIALSDVVFRPHGVATADDRPLAHIERVIVYPRVSSLATGEPSLARVVIEGPTVSAVVRSDGGSHADWFEWLIHELRSRDVESSGDAAVAGAGGIGSGLPTIEVVDGRLSFDDPTGRYPSVGARLDELQYGGAGSGDIDGRVLIEGLGRGEITGSLADAAPRLSLRLLDETDVFPLIPFDVASSPDAQLSVGTVHLDWPLRVSLSDVEANGLSASLPGLADRTLDTIEADTVAVSLDGGGVRLEADTTAFIFGGADRRQLSVARATVERAWVDPFPTATLELIDASGNAATLEVEESSEGVFDGTLQSTDFEVSHFAALFPPSVRTEILAGTFGGAMQLRWNRSRGEMEADVAGRFSDLTIESALLSAEPIHGIAASLEVEIDYWVDSGSFLVDRARLLFPEYGLYVNGSASRSDTRRTIDLHASLPPRDAQGLLDSLPAGIADTLIGFRLAGTFGFDATVSADTDDIDSAVADVTFSLDGFEVVEFGPRAPIDRLLEDEFTWQVRTFEGETRRVGLGDESWVPLEDLAALTYRAIVAAEDDRFWDHGGFDRAAILSALRTNLTEGRVVRGSSTISQQVAKNLFLNHDRTLSRKLQEAFLAWQLEQCIPKRSILEIYLNLVHWGPGTYGIRDAAMAYFNHMPGQLTLRESAFLAAILPNPTLFGQQYTEGIISPSRRQKMSNLLYNLHRGGYLSEPTRRYHASLVSEGRISNTPPPRALGVHAPSDEALPPGLDRLGSLLFSR